MPCLPRYSRMKAFSDGSTRSSTSTGGWAGGVCVCVCVHGCVGNVLMCKRSWQPVFALPFGSCDWACVDEKAQLALPL